VSTTFHQVQYQFLNHPADTKEEFIEAYLVGRRLCKFLSKVLPTHQDYFVETAELNRLRTNSQAQLAELLPYLDQLERVIDEDEHQQYIRHVLGTDDDEEEEESDEEEQGQDEELSDKWQQAEEDTFDLNEEELLQDQSNVNTTISSHEFLATENQEPHQERPTDPSTIPNNTSNDTSAEMDMILENNSLMAYSTEEEPPRSNTVSFTGSSNASRRLLLHRASHRSPSPPSTKTAGASRTTPIRMPMNGSTSINAINSQSPQQAAATDWDNAWHQTTLRQSSPRPPKNESPRVTNTSPRALTLEPPRPAAKSSPRAFKLEPPRFSKSSPRALELESPRNTKSSPRALTLEPPRNTKSSPRALTLEPPRRPVSLQEQVRGLSPVRPIAQLRKESTAANRPARIPEHEAVRQSQLPRTAVDLDDTQNDDETETGEWNFPYSASAPDWMSAASSTDVSSKWTMKLSMASSQFKAAPVPASSDIRSSPIHIRVMANQKAGLRQSSPGSSLLRKANSPVKVFHDSGFSEPRQAHPSRTLQTPEEDFINHIATAFFDQDTDLLLESKIEKRWQHARRQNESTSVANHSFTTRRDGSSPKSIIDMDNWMDASREETPKKKKLTGKKPLLMNRSKAGNMNATPLSKPDSFRRLNDDDDIRVGGEEEDDSASLVEARALTRRARALQPFKSCVRCLLE
jgi:hypothetical protein